MSDEEDIHGDPWEDEMLFQHPWVKAAHDIGDIQTLDSTLGVSVEEVVWGEGTDHEHTINVLCIVVANPGGIGMATFPTHVIDDIIARFITAKAIIDSKKTNDSGLMLPFNSDVRESAAMARLENEQGKDL